MVRSRGLRTSTPLFGYMHLKHAFADSATTANFNLVATTGSNAYLKLIKCVQERSRVLSKLLIYCERLVWRGPQGSGGIRSK
jgi:hypothetical protein